MGFQPKTSNIYNTKSNRNASTYTQKVSFTNTYCCNGSGSSTDNSECCQVNASAIQDISAHLVVIDSSINYLMNIGDLSGINALLLDISQNVYDNSRSIIEVNQEVDDLSGVVRDLSSSVHDLSGEIFSLPSVVNDLSSVVLDLSGDHNTLNTAFLDLSGKVVTNTNNISTNTTNITSLTGVVNDLSSVVLDLSGDHNTLNNAFLDLSGKVVTNTTNIATKVSKTGDTMTGNLTIDKATPQLILENSSNNQGIIEMNDNNNLNYLTNVGRHQFNNNVYVNGYVDISDGLTFTNSTLPSNITNKLYRLGNDIYWDNDKLSVWDVSGTSLVLDSSYTELIIPGSTTSFGVDKVNKEAILFTDLSNIKLNVQGNNAMTLTNTGVDLSGAVNFANSLTAEKGLVFSSFTPQNTASTLYTPNGTQLYFNGSVVGDAGGDVTNLTNVVNDLSSVVLDLSGDHNTLNTAFLDLSGKVVTNTSNISTNTSNISTNTSNISTNTSNISTNTNNITSLTGVVNDLSSVVLDLSGDHNTLNTAFLDLSGKVVTNTTNISTNTNNITSLTGVVNDLSSVVLDLSGDHNTLNTTFLDLSGKVVTNTSAISTNTSNITSLTGVVNDLSSVVLDLSGKVVTNTSAISTNTNNITNLTGVVNDLSSVVLDLSGDHNTLNTAFIDLSGDHNTLNTAFLDLSGNHNTLNTAFIDLSGNHNTLNTAFIDLSGDHNTLNTAFLDLSGKVVTNTSAISTIKGNGWVNETIKGNATAIASNTTAISNNTTKINSLTGVVDDLSSVVLDLSSVVLDLSGDHNTLNTAFIDLSGDHNTLNIAFIDLSGRLGTNTTNIATKVSKSGDTMSGALEFAGINTYGGRVTTTADGLSLQTDNGSNRSYSEKIRILDNATNLYTPTYHSQDLIITAGKGLIYDNTITNPSDTKLYYDKPNTSLKFGSLNISNFDTSINNLNTDVNTIKGNGWVNETIKGNATAISNNSTSISNNATAISTIKGSGWTNETIKGNATAISNNATSISNNSTSISNNSTSISNNATAISTIKGNGWVNETIKGNATAIATNTSIISTKVSKTGDTMTGDLSLNGNLVMKRIGWTDNSDSSDKIHLGRWEIQQYILPDVAYQMLFFRYYNGSTSIYDDKGYLDRRYNVGNIDFTGQHRQVITNPITELKEGMILVSTGQIKNYATKKEDLNKPTINEALPILTLSTKAKMKSVFGVYSGSKDINEHKTGIYVSILEPTDKTETFHYVNGSGEGAILVNKETGTIENGDFIMTSSIKGIGCKSDSDNFTNYTIAKATQHISQAKDQGYGVYLISCLYML